MTLSLEARCRDLIEALSLGSAAEVHAIKPLTGGVSSDIASVSVGDADYCIKFALPKLKVAADWRAPVHRNAAEYAWLQVAIKVMPQGAVRLFGRSEEQHGFAMELIAGEHVYLWKTAMLDGKPSRGEAAAVGRIIGRIHAASAQSGFDTSPFQNRDDFRALRIEPYLSFTAEAHGQLAPELGELADMLYDGNVVLVHGDVSPKNIMIRQGTPVILDAECATMGDPSFDPAFCLNHLVLKAIHLPGSRAELFDAAGQFWTAYRPHITWEDAAGLEARVCRLLAALMLARIDGKSPVEYLDETRREQVRQLAIPLINSPAATLCEFVDELKSRLKELDK